MSFGQVDEGLMLCRAQLFDNVRPFDTDYMRKLYNTGYALALKGFPWLKVPPGFAPPSAAATGPLPPQ